MYRENIYDIMKNTGEEISTLVIPKNSGLSYIGQVLKEAGLDISNAKRLGKDKMVLDNLTLLLERGEDIPRVVMDFSKNGEVVLGITGDDLYDEFMLENPGSQLRVENTYDWCNPKAKFLKPALCLINKTGNIDDIPMAVEVAINLKYKYTAKQYLEKGDVSGERTFSITLYKGNIERRVEQGKDCGIEIVYSGSSLEKKGLEIADVVRLSDIVVISPLKEGGGLIGKVLEGDYQQILGRLIEPTDSYTSRLLKDNEKITRKMNEEAYELIQAFYGRGNLVEESADMLYALNLMLAKKGVSLEDIAKEMAKRQK